MKMKQVGELRMWILHVIDENGSSNGVEIMDSVQAHYDLQVEWHKEEHAHPHQEPDIKSKRLLPGSIYPMLKKMVSEGLITKHDDGKYDLTKKGRIVITNLFKHFQFPKNRGSSPISIENSLTAMNWHVSYMEETDKQQIARNIESIESLIERLEKLKKSVQGPKSTKT
jgi:DNA-binding PadR family transcriptional regulator